MKDSHPFVGREAELERFLELLEEPRGQAIVVVGNRGMGKTWLVNQMAKLASEHPRLQCGQVRYEVAPTDSPDSTMAIMMDNAFEAGQVKEGSFDGTQRGLEQWRSFLNVLNLGDLVMSLRREPAKDTRQQFLERLGLISRRMQENGRAIFIVDPEKYMAKDSDQTWAMVVKNLPEKIKFIFAQRTEDVLIGSEVIESLDNAVRIPSNTLDTLSEEDVDELINCRRANLKVEMAELRKVLGRYKGYPYAIGAALDLVERGTKLEELPRKPEPTKFAELQWKKVCDENGTEAIRLFKAYTILAAAVPDEAARETAEINEDVIQHLSANKFISGLLRNETRGRRIYHSILADYILEQISEAEKKGYHRRAAAVYRQMLREAEEKQRCPDEVAVQRLPEHVLESEGAGAFVVCFVNECEDLLRRLGLLDIHLRLSDRALQYAGDNSVEKAAVLGNLGSVYQTRGQLEEAEEMYNKSLAIEKQLGRLEGMASDYGNLGIIYRIRGQLDKAEEMYNKALEINKQLGRLEGMANQYGNLGIVYHTCGQLDKAEEMYNKALEIHKQLGSLEGMASDYGNLGIVYHTCGQLDKAEEMYYKALEINKQFGRLEGMAIQYGNLGGVYQTRGQLDKAEEMHRKALEINKQLGRLEGMANQYGNLGNVYRTRGQKKTAMEFWQKAKGLFERLGAKDRAEKVQGWIEGLEGK